MTAGGIVESITTLKELHMRISSAVSAGILVLGLATLIPSAIVASATDAAPRFDCRANCNNGSCWASGSKCDCWCDTYGQPHCGCDET